MITFQRKGDLPQPVPGESEQNRFDRIRKLAAEKHRNRILMACRVATHRRPRTTTYRDVAVTAWRATRAAGPKN